MQIVLTEPQACDTGQQALACYCPCACAPCDRVAGHGMLAVAFLNIRAHTKKVYPSLAVMSVLCCLTDATARAFVLTPPRIALVAGVRMLLLSVLLSERNEIKL